MRLRTWLIILVLAGAVALTWGLLKLKSQPPEVQFARVIRETIRSSVPTNGKVEPFEFAEARAERAGPVTKIMVERGQQVAKDQALVEIDSTEAQAALKTAQARIAAAQAELAIIERGGRTTELAEIDSSVKRYRHDLEVAQKELESSERLVAKGAAARIELTQGKQKVDSVQLLISSLEEKRAALGASSSQDRSAAQSRLDDAEAAVKLADLQIRQSVVRAPINGTVYEFDLKPGAYLNAGIHVASIGRLDSVKVNVLVDEPDLGHVKVGMPVRITWDAVAGREWTGEVDQLPTEIETQGTRQVGKVVCVIRNPDRALLPNTNVNVEIRTESVENVLTAPKEAVRTEHGQTGVYLLNGEQLAWKPVKSGVSNVTRVQVEGLNEGDAIAMFSETPLHNGLMVKPAFP
jgi:HlyD family secretion protein